MMRVLALLLFLVLAPRPADCTVLRPGEIGVFHDRAATQRIGSMPPFVPFYVCARLDAAGLTAARYRVEAWTPEGLTATIADVDLQVGPTVPDANGVVVVGTHFHMLIGQSPYLRIVCSATP